MTSNERVRLIRNEIKLSAEKFGEKLGVTRATISAIETGKNQLTELMTKSICREFHVNEAWLRSGEGEMFDETPSSALQALAREYDLPRECLILIEKFCELNEEQRAAVLEYVMEVSAALQDEKSKRARDIDAEVEDYRRQLELEARQEEKSPASPGFGEALA